MTKIDNIYFIHLKKDIGRKKNIDLFCKINNLNATQINIIEAFDRIEITEWIKNNNIEKQNEILSKIVSNIGYLCSYISHVYTLFIYYCSNKTDNSIIFEDDIAYEFM